MQRIDGRFIYSASDLNEYLECRHLAELERLVALRERTRPESDPATALLARKGDEHEARYLERLKERYADALVICSPRGESSVEAWTAGQAETLAAMEAGAQIIYQAMFFDGIFLGRADFLRRVERPSARWAWSYEAIDTKLGLSPKPYYLVQLCSYSEHLERLQGTPPHEMHVVLGSGCERSFRVEDFAAYYRHLKAGFLERMASAPNDTYPFEVPHCAICNWRTVCAKRRDDDDHLSLVASIQRTQIAKLEGGGITTVAALGRASDEQRPFGMAEVTFAKLRAQSALQHVQRTQGRYVYELLDSDATAGFGAMPRPDDGDVFFDMEGDPLYRPDRGLEYLFGVFLPRENEYRGFWARSDREERGAFERFMDFIDARLREHPKLHVYHYAPYETVALKRLAGRFGSREEILDRFLQRAVFVDLYAVVRHALRVSQPSYSIKKLEAFYGMARTTKTKRGDDSVVMFESWLLAGDDAILEDIERYNDDDCRSTFLLRNWLLELREERNASLDEPLPFRDLGDGDEPDPAEAEPRTELEHRLLDGLDDIDSPRELRNAPENVRARWLLGHLLQFHRRDQKPEWWKYFERIEHPGDLLEHDTEAIAGLSLRTDIAAYKLAARDRNLVHTYEFPPQEHHLRSSAICVRGGKSVDIVRIDDRLRTIEVKVADAIAMQLQALIPGRPIPDRIKREAIEGIAREYFARTLSEDHPATRDLLLGCRPRIRGLAINDPVQPATVSVQAVSEIVARLDESALFVQGPPGSGKTTAGAAAIVDLLADGKRIGIVANSHKAVHNLLAAIETAAFSNGTRFRGIHKASIQTEGSRYDSPLAVPMVTNAMDAQELAGDRDLISGTTFAWAHPTLVDRCDYLFIDEAGQIALADALIASRAARNVVLLGDPLQLPQVSQGTHPVGSGISVLEHLLGGAPTVDERSGIFLDLSYRMHPDICTFISRTIYDGRLRAAPETANNRVESPGLSGSGLRYVPIEHTGNRRSSVEEAQRIADEVDLLLQGSFVRNGDAAQPLRERDILVVTPYNRQRRVIAEHLEHAGRGSVQVGTVDKFQGQEAPVVFYSMATSSGAEIPRDAAFLFDAHRFNVAISRAQCLSVLLCSPRLLDIRANTPEQMSLVNLLCAYTEAAIRVP